MEFDSEKDSAIFEEIFKRRPEIDLAKFKTDLQKYYLPYVDRLVTLKKGRSDDRGIIVGVSAIQGAGKTTQGEILEKLLAHFGYGSVSLSIDDHYITHEELSQLRQKDPRYIRRGVTHDLKLAVGNLRALQNMSPGSLVLVAEYDKGAHAGDGDRFAWVVPPAGASLVMVREAGGMKLREVVYRDQRIPTPENMGAAIPLEEHLFPAEVEKILPDEGGEIRVFGRDDGNVCFVGRDKVVVLSSSLPRGWQLVWRKPDFIFYDGWMLGARKVEDGSVFDQSLPALETPEAKQFARDINEKLADYEELWSLVDFLNVLYVPHYEMAITWRDDAEKVLREKGEGMNPEQIKEFVYYFWRSVHPAIHIKSLAHDEGHTAQVAIIGDDHSIVEVLSPAQVREKYP